MRFRLFCVLAAATVGLTALPARAVEVSVESVALDTQDTDRDTVGRLIWRGGIAIASEDPRFGGLSALHVSQDGRRMIALSDRGQWLTASLTYRSGMLAGIRTVSIAPLLDTAGKPLRGRRADAESLASGDDWVVSFERHHRLWGYKTRDGGRPGRPTALNGPAGLKALSDNGGIEAMTRLCDGRLLILAEKPTDATSGVKGWHQTGTGWAPFRYRTVATLRPTGAVTLPNCDVAIVERSFSFVAGLDIRVVLLRPKNIGEDVKPVEIARLSDTLTIDNFEGIAVRRGADGETLIYLVSDDNFSNVQRTLLFMFELGDPP